MNKFLCIFIGIVIGLSGAYPIHIWVLERELASIEIATDIGIAKFLSNRMIELDVNDFRCETLNMIASYASLSAVNVDEFGEPRFYEQPGISDYLNENVTEVNNVLVHNDIKEIQKKCIN